MVEEGWVDTLKKEVIEYTVDRDRHKEMLSLFKKVAIVLNDINDRVDRDNLKDYSDEEIKLMKNTLMRVEEMVR
jgi:nitrogenase molybdenum-iron protein alpha/beta subunit|tara:strand:- start:231 stop:452 length:222 start_codon:yes stop_codon:yes gene_type:complete